jgi:hypothetical protein
VSDLDLPVFGAPENQSSGLISAQKATAVALRARSGSAPQGQAALILSEVEGRRACGSLDRLKQIETGWIWPNGRPCHLA